MALFFVTNKSCTSLKYLKRSFVIFRSVSSTFTRRHKIVSFENRNFLHKYALLAIPLVTFSLGTWQVCRWRYKLQLLEKLKMRLNVPSVPLEDNLDNLTTLEYRLVTARGTYDHSREVFIGARALLVDGAHEGGYDTTRNKGFHVITPFRLQQSNIEILVNRGWVSCENKDPHTRQGGQVTGLQDIVARVRLSDRKSRMFDKQNMKVTRIYVSRDIELISQHLGTEPIFLDLCSEGCDVNIPRADQTLASLYNKHVEYFITWYGMSLCTLLMWLSSNNFRSFKR